MKYFIVWNETKTFGVITSDQQLAYETRKSADANCFDANGKVSRTAQTFCDEYANDNCTIQDINLDDWIEWNGGQCPVTDDTTVDVRFRNGLDLHCHQYRPPICNSSLVQCAHSSGGAGACG